MMKRAAVASPPRTPTPAVANSGASSPELSPSGSPERKYRRFLESCPNRGLLEAAVQLLDISPDQWPREEGQELVWKSIEMPIVGGCQLADLRYDPSGCPCRALAGRIIDFSHAHDGITATRPTEPPVPASEMICRPPRTITPSQLVSELGDLQFLNLNNASNDEIERLARIMTHTALDCRGDTAVPDIWDTWTDFLVAHPEWLRRVDPCYVIWNFPGGVPPPAFAATLAAINFGPPIQAGVAGAAPTPAPRSGILLSAPVPHFPHFTEVTFPAGGLGSFEEEAQRLITYMSVRFPGVSGLVLLCPMPYTHY